MHFVPGDLCHVRYTRALVPKRRHQNEARTRSSPSLPDSACVRCRFTIASPRHFQLVGNCCATLQISAATMSFQWASRTGVLRHLRLGNAFSRPTRVISAQNQLRRVCLATKPQLRIPSTGFKSALLSQQSHGFATTAESAKGSPKKKGSSTKSKSAKSKKPKAKKPGRKPAKKPSEKTLARRQADKQRAEVKALKTAALKEPKALNDRSWPLAVAAKMTELKGQFPAQKDLFVEASKAAKNMTPEELAVCPVKMSWLSFVIVHADNLC